jgi:iron complex outermembrane receptor protein
VNRRTALFCSLFLAIAVSILSPFSTRAAAAEEEPLEVKDVVVSSTRLPDTPVDARTLPAKVTVITAEEIRKSGAKTVQEAIQWATGIVMYDQVGNSFQQSIDLRGFNGQPVPATSVVVDGQRINEPDFNTVSFDLIPYETIERIEIIPGASAIYGKNALGGVINIITKRGTAKHQVTGETLFGSFQRQRYALNASGLIGKFDYYTSFSRETEDGFRDQSDARMWRFFGKMGYRPTDQTDITFSYTYGDSRLAQAGTLPVSIAALDRRRNFTPGDFFDSESHVVRLTARQQLPLGFSINLNGFYRNLAQDQFTRGQSSISTNDLITESRGGVLQLTHEAVPLDHRNQLTAGAEVTSNSFGNNSIGSFFCCAGTFPAARNTEETIIGLYVQDTFHILSNLILSGGVRYDKNDLSFLDKLDSANTGERTFYRITPRAGITFLPTAQSSVYFSYSEGFRVPTYNELFGLGVGVFGSANPNLRPVRSHNYEVGGKVQVGRFGEVSLALFQSEVRDEIIAVCVDPSTCGSFSSPTNQNVDKSRRRGIEATYKNKWNTYFDSIVNYTFTEATFQSDQVLNPYFIGFNPYLEQVQKGDSLPMIPKHRLSVTGNFHPTPSWTISVMGLYAGSQFHINDEENAQPRVPGYFLLNGRIAYEHEVPGGKLTGFLHLNNILDQKYSTFGIIAPNTVTGGGAPERFVMPAPGFAVFGGLSYRFEGL